MAVVESHQIGNQVIVLDYLQLIRVHIFLDGVRPKIRPRGKVVETFTLVLRRLNDMA